MKYILFSIISTIVSVAVVVVVPLDGIYVNVTASPAAYP